VTEARTMSHHNPHAFFLDGLNLSLHDAEAKIVSLLASAQDVDSNVLSACEQFEIILPDVLRLLAGNRQSRYWQLDDLSCDFISRTQDIVTLKGFSNWLSGGDGCDRSRLDVSLNHRPLLIPTSSRTASPTNRSSTLARHPTAGS
jgi:hypothetical protein